MESEYFTKSMLTFLQCDIGDGNIKTILSEYIKNENSSDILKLILIKLSLYYGLRYFGNNFNLDQALLDLITDVQLKLAPSNKLVVKANKDMVKEKIRKQYNDLRNKMVI